MWEWEFRKLQRALRVLMEYGADTTAVDDDLADVAADYVRYAVEHLKEITGEIDARYAGQE